ncbi:MAG: peptidylprolyl isomerase [Gammaproteobacteria bacterium]|jgi:FKBP-type peptidyl-prolyl cis-trans isomerase SlyD|nr:peptidylprolyl isomerase [Gammaproteobacteria bacterium]
MADQFVEQNKVVSFVYTIVDTSGTLLEQSDIPISYIHGGKHDLFEKVEQALDGAVVSDTVEVTLTPEEGFGTHDPDLTYMDDIENVPDEFRRLGAEVEMMNDQGDSKKFTVTRIEDGKLTVDGNHPMAGKTIIFRINVTGIRDATPEELAKGVDAMAMPVLH